MSKLLVNQAVEMATLPGTEGEFSVLKGHQDMLFLLCKGKLMLKLANGKLQEFVADGFLAKVRSDSCLVLVNNLQSVDAS